MIKKIGAIVLALVLCLSVIVVPVSAAKVELGDAQMAFKLEWDKESYSAGDTAYLSVYMDAADDLSLYTGSFLIGLNSSVFSQTDNPIATVKGNTEVSELFNSYWKGSDNLSWLAASIVTRVQSANTEEENAKFDQYLKFTAARNSAGSHENVSNTKDGFHGDEFNPEEPIMTIGLIVGSVPDGTAVEASITSGSITCNPAQTAWKYWTNPGNATTTGNLSNFDVSQTVVSATVGEVATSIIAHSYSQIRFRGIGATSTKDDYKGEFDVRTLATLTVEDTDDTVVKSKIEEIGFIYYESNNEADYSVETAKAVVEGTESNADYVRYDVKYLQSVGGGKYNFSCLIDGIPDADKDNGVHVLGFVKYDGEMKYYVAATEVSYRALYDQYMPA